MDLHAITLNQKMEELVELLAENTHNVWAKERIQQGWTYALSEVQYFIMSFRICQVETKKYLTR